MGRDYSLWADWPQGQWLRFFLISSKYRKNEGIIRDSYKAHAPTACYHSCDIDSVQKSKSFQCSVNFGSLQITFLNVNWNLLWHWQEVVADQSSAQCSPLLSSIFWSFIGLLVKIWHRNKTTCSNSKPVQSSRSKILNQQLLIQHSDCLLNQLPVLGKGVC